MGLDSISDLLYTKKLESKTTEISKREDGDALKEEIIKGDFDYGKDELKIPSKKYQPE